MKYIEFENDEVSIIGIDYVIFRNKKTGNLYVNSELSGKVPKWFFNEKKEENWDDGNMIDVRSIDPAYFHPFRNYTLKEMEMFKRPRTFEHFRRRIELIAEKSDGFYNHIKYKVLNLVPTKNDELVKQLNEYLYQKFGSMKYERIVRRCSPWLREKMKKS